MSSRPYFWLIDEDADTTTSDLNDHTYDRYLFFMLLLSCSESHDFIFSLENIWISKLLLFININTFLF